MCMLTTPFVIKGHFELIIVSEAFENFSSFLINNVIRIYIIKMQNYGPIPNLASPFWDIPNLALLFWESAHLQKKN